MTRQRAARTRESEGTTYGFLAYLIWGVFPLYFHALKPAGPWEVLCHRILWTVAVCALGLAVQRRIGFFLGLFRDLRRLAMVTIAGVLIAINWIVYIAAVSSGHTIEAALGYFLNPLVTVALGVLVLRERLRPMQWVAVAIGVVAGVYLTIDYGKPPWISITLALSFASYGLMKKRIGGSMDALQGLAAESFVLTPIAAVVLAVLTLHGHTTFTTDGLGHTLLLVSTGVATAAPLLLFAAAASRVPLVTIGLLQFITPVLQLLCGVLALGEHMSTARWIGFGIVWLALIVLTVDTLTATTKARRLARSAEGAAL